MALWLSKAIISIYMSELTGPSIFFWQLAKHGKPWALAQGHGMFFGGTAPQLKMAQKKLLAEVFRDGLQHAYSLYVMIDLIQFGYLYPY